MEKKQQFEARVAEMAIDGKPCIELIGADGTKLLVKFSGATPNGITIDEARALAEQLVWMINEFSVELPKRIVDR
jgi:hypothetical protein